MNNAIAPDGGADATGLQDARAVDRLGPYLRATWERREWSWYVAASELRSRQVNSVLGNLWHLLNPLLQVGVFFLFFGLILQTDRGVDNFLGYLSIGIFVYLHSQKATLAGGKSMLQYRQLMQLISFPRALVPITSTMTEALAALSGYFVMVVVVVTTGETFTPAWLLVVPLFAVQVVFNAGLALITARAVHRVYDIQQVLPFVFRLGFYASGVLFNVNAYLEDNPLQVVFELNPLYCFIETYRGLLLDSNTVDTSLVITALIWSFAVFVVGMLWFRGAEDSYGSE